MNTAVATTASAPTAAEARAAAKLVRIKTHFDEIKAKFGTKCLKSEHVFVDLSPRHLDYLRAHGTKIGTGWYSLEAYYGEKPAGEFTPLPEGTVVAKERGAAPAPVQAVEPPAPAPQVAAPVAAKPAKAKPGPKAKAVKKAA